MTKTCTRCKTERELTEFHKATANADGLHRWCKPCAADYQRTTPRKTKKKRYPENPENRRAAGKRYYARNKEKVLERGRARKAKLKEQKLAEINAKRAARGARMASLGLAPAGDVRASIASLFKQGPQKTCARCHERLPVAAFPGKKQLNAYCRACCSTYARARRKADGRRPVL